MNFCPLFFATPSWPEVLDQVVAAGQAAVDFAQVSKEGIMIHEWTHITNVMWWQSEDTVYKVRNCRKLVRYHDAMPRSMDYGRNEYSARHSPGTADCEKLYIKSLVMDAEARIRALFGNQRNANRRSSAEPDPEADLMPLTTLDVLYDESITLWQPRWDSYLWPPRTGSGSDGSLSPGSRRSSSPGSSGRRSPSTGGGGPPPPTSGQAPGPAAAPLGGPSVAGGSGGTAGLTLGKRLAAAPAGGSNLGAGL